jgi:adenine-specific DNA-methyltransferase
LLCHSLCLILIHFDDWQNNIKKGAAAYLIDFPDTPYESYPEKHKEYIQNGIESGINKGFKCSIRDRWYRIPSIWAPDAFFLRRNNKFPKFVLNCINAVSTDTMHRIKFKDHVDKRKALLSYYNSITFAFTELEGRSYGGGVLEVLPGEVEASTIPDLKNFDEKTLNELIVKLDKVIRSNEDIEPLLDEIDKKVLIDFLNIDEGTVKTFRAIWKKMMARRHNRKIGYKPVI